MASMLVVVFVAAKSPPTTAVAFLTVIVEAKNFVTTDRVAWALVVTLAGTDIRMKVVRTAIPPSTKGPELPMAMV
jgi:hypothetical protein